MSKKIIENTGQITWLKNNDYFRKHEMPLSLYDAELGWIAKFFCRSPNIGYNYSVLLKKHAKKIGDEKNYNIDRDGAMYIEIIKGFVTINGVKCITLGTRFIGEN